MTSGMTTSGQWLIKGAAVIGAATNRNCTSGTLLPVPLFRKAMEPVARSVAMPVPKKRARASATAIRSARI